MYSNSLCMYYCTDKSREMSVHIAYEKWLRGPISAWGRHGMAAISSCFSFTITSHFLFYLLIMNCTVLCPIGLFSQGLRIPIKSNADVSCYLSADFNKAMDKFKVCVDGKTTFKCKTETHRHASNPCEWSDGECGRTQRCVAVYVFNM